MKLRDIREIPFPGLYSKKDQGMSFEHFISVRVYSDYHVMTRRVIHAEEILFDALVTPLNVSPARKKPLMEGKIDRAGNSLKYF